MAAGAELVGGHARQLDAEPRVDVLHEARTVEAGRALAAPDVGDAQLASGHRDGALGTLISQGSDTPEVRFHLGELLYWFGDPTDAAAQWRQVMDDAPGSLYGRTARELLAKIS